LRRLAPALALLSIGTAAAAQTAKPPVPRPPATRQQLLEKAKAELAQGRADEAMALLRSAADRYQSVQALVELARIQSSRRDPQAALATLGRARTLAPNSEEVLSAYAQVALARHAPVPAIFALEPLTRMAASVGQYHYLYGVALLQAGDMEAGGEALQRSEKLEPNRPLTLIALGLAFNNRKLYAEAKPFLLRGLGLEPDNVEALAALAEAEEGLSELAEAEAHAQRALARQAGHATGNLVVGMVRMRQQRYAEARDALERAVASDPGSAKAHYQLSLACARLGDDASAQKQVELYQRALREMEERLAQLHGPGAAPEGIVK
jgi:tetratricopeptide (TPR) repeat protein